MNEWIDVKKRLPKNDLFHNIHWIYFEETVGLAAYRGDGMWSPIRDHAITFSNVDFWQELEQPTKENMPVGWEHYDTPGDFHLGVDIFWVAVGEIPYEHYLAWWKDSKWDGGGIALKHDEVKAWHLLSKPKLPKVINK